MKVYFDEAFYQVYTADPAASAGRMEAIVAALDGTASFEAVRPAAEIDLLRVHGPRHLAYVRDRGLYDIAALAAGGAILAAQTGLCEPAFALIRPPGHHASADSAWGFCYFNNMAVALARLQAEGRIRRALVLDVDLHYGDGNVNILGRQPWATIVNPEAGSAERYLDLVETALATEGIDIIGVSAGFDNHREDWGGLLATEDYETIGRLVRRAAARNRGGCFGVLEGGYNHSVLGGNVRAFLRGMENRLQ
jgi:acetoin utilization deacetylase AcuC-like enzyme